MSATASSVIIEEEATVSAVGTFTGTLQPPIIDESYTTDPIVEVDDPSEEEVIPPCYSVRVDQPNCYVARYTDPKCFTLGRVYPPSDDFEYSFGNGPTTGSFDLGDQDPDASEVYGLWFDNASSVFRRVYLTYKHDNGVVANYRLVSFDYNTTFHDVSDFTFIGYAPSTWNRTRIWGTDDNIILYGENIPNSATIYGRHPEAYQTTFNPVSPERFGRAKNPFGVYDKLLVGTAWTDGSTASFCETTTPRTIYKMNVWEEFFGHTVQSDIYRRVQGGAYLCHMENGVIFSYFGNTLYLHIMEGDHEVGYFSQSGSCYFGYRTVQTTAIANDNLIGNYQCDGDYIMFTRQKNDFLFYNVIYDAKTLLFVKEIQSEKDMTLVGDGYVLIPNTGSPTLIDQVHVDTL